MASSTTSNSTLPAAALQASRAALSAALADQEASTSITEAPESTEPGEIQEVEVDMQKQAEQIRTVFSDPNNFNVKVSFSNPRTPCLRS
jgi:translation initiation factor 4E